MIAFALGAVALLVLALIGLPLGFCLLFVGITGFAILHPGGFPIALQLAGQQVFDTATSYQFAALPLFIAMGVLASGAGLARELFDSAQRWIGHWRGGMAMATIAACGAFSAISGSSVATAATIAKSALPAMRKVGYRDDLATGSVAAGGTLGILIPPSGMLIIYGLLTETSIAQLFAAGMIPGFITVVLFIAAIGIVTRRAPDIGPAGPRYSWGERFKSLRSVGGIAALFTIIMAGLFFGVFTANEAGGIGAAGAAVIAALRGALGPARAWRLLAETAETSAAIFLMIFGSLVFTQFVNFSGFPQEILSFIRGIDAPPLAIVAVILLIYLGLGMFLDGAAMLFLTVPIFVPVIEALGYDLIWWGIVAVVAVELSLITPPVGINIYVIKAMSPETPVLRIVRGVLPFLLANILLVGLLIALPGLALWLPSLMYR